MGTVADAVKDSCGPLDTWQTRAAIVLAEAVDAGTGGAAATRELRSLMAQITDLAPAEAKDPLDDLASRRSKRRGA